MEEYIYILLLFVVLNISTKHILIFFKINIYDMLPHSIYIYFKKPNIRYLNKKINT